MDYSSATAQILHRADQLAGEIEGRIAEHPRLHELVADWLRTIDDLRRENRDLRRENEILRSQWRTPMPESPVWIQRLP